MAYKYIDFKEIGLKKFEEAISSLLKLPVNKREDFDSLDEIERSLEYSKKNNLTVLQLQQRDYTFLKSQLDYALSQRFLNDPKAWRPIVTMIDEAESKRPEEFPLEVEKSEKHDE